MKIKQYLCTEILDGLLSKYCFGAILVLAFVLEWLLLDYGVIGNTRDFGPLITGSSPVSPTKSSYSSMDRTRDF